eukprot:m.40520 g.40520  ORF g.40520 m.40520 type:complete len:157 (+) comp10360_c0_seq1:144-614(+)
MATKVYVYLYDLSNGMMAAMSPSMLGTYLPALYHTSIVVHGKEYFFGGGIQKATPETTNAGRPIERLELGETEIPEFMLEAYLEDLHNKFNVQSYHLLDNNCNHFSEELAQFLVGKSIPDKVKNLPGQFLSTPLGMMMAPMIDSFFSSIGGDAAPV